MAQAVVTRASRGGRPLTLILALWLAVAAGGCSMRRIVAGQVGNALAESGDVFTRDDDPELVRDAIPFGLKTIESLLEIVPRHEGLLLAACRGFVLYAYAFVESEADLVAFRDHREAEAKRARALRLYLRALGYGLRGLEVRHRGIVERLKRDPATAVAKLRKRDVPMLYWASTAWGSAISVGRDQPAIAADLGAAMVMIRRALELDETYENGAVHEAMIVLESLPDYMGGSPERARMHFQRAVEMSRGTRPTPYVLLASSVSVARQDRAEFERLLRAALAIDPDAHPATRLEAIVMRRRAGMLLEHVDDLFLEPVPAEADTIPAEEIR